MNNAKNHKKPEHLKIGALGEDITCRFLKQKGFKIIERNYRKKWGEIDVVAEKENILRFVEVKSVSRITSDENVIHETSERRYRPEDMVHPWKVKRMQRVIQSYLFEKNISEYIKWQFDIVAVEIDQNRKTAKVRFIENMIL
ncbi:MAG: YraN family protein [Parcubacteria group bacterium]|nr:YraN family protein [Parcubacteria group bacterium]